MTTHCVHDCEMNVALLYNTFDTTCQLTLGAIGIFGVFILVNATSQVLNNPEYDQPVVGALMLFAGLFNVFVAIIHLLLAFAGRDD